MTKSELITAKAILAQRGWTFVCATMAGADGGLVYTKDDHRFRLNAQTFRQVLAGANVDDFTADMMLIAN